MKNRKEKKIMDVKVYDQHLQMMLRIQEITPSVSRLEAYNGIVHIVRTEVLAERLLTGYYTMMIPATKRSA
jgi:hypothetical protein